MSGSEEIKKRLKETFSNSPMPDFVAEMNRKPSPLKAESTPNNARDEINRLANGALESLSNRNLVMLKLLIDDILRLTSPIS